MPYIRRQKKNGQEPAQLPEESVVPRSNWLVELPLYLLLVFTPIAIGTVHTWSIGVMLLLATGSFAAMVIRRAQRHQRSLKLFPMGLALLGVTLLTLIQVVPLPPLLLRLLNPSAGDIFDHVLADAGLWGAGQWRPVSLDPPGTALELIKFLSYTLAFVVVVNYFNDRHRARRLMKAIAWTGFLVALIGFFSKLFVATGILGLVPVDAGTFFFSTFVNPNHLSGYLALCAPVAIGLALSARERQDRALFGFMGIITGVAVFMTLSRGGIVAFSAGCCFLLLFAATRRIKRIRQVAVIQGVVAAVLLVAGYLAYDTIISEMKTLGDLTAVREDAKIQAWKGTLEMIKDYPVVGIGRGAFASVYPRYKTVPNDLTWTHAENGVLQVMAEWGPVIGFCFLAMFGLCCFFALSRARESLSMGGCLAGIFAVSLQNLVDFNLEVAGVALTFTVILGVLAASPFSHASGPRKFEVRLRLPRMVAVAIIPITLLGGAYLLFYSANHNMNTETAALLAEDKPQGCEPCQETAFCKAACDLLRHHPADYLAPMSLGKAWLESEPKNLDRAVHWLNRALYLNPRSSMAHRLTGRALYFFGQREQALNEYRLAAEADRSILTSTVVEVLRLSGDPNAAIKATPVDAESYLASARILHTLGKDEAAASAARAALELASSRIEILDLLGDLALAAGRLKEAAGVARQIIELDPLHDRAYLAQGEVLLRQNESEKAEAAWLLGLDQVPDSTMLAYRLGEHYLGQEKLKEAEEIANRLQTFAPSDDSSQAQLHMLFGRIQEGRGMLFEARRSYRLASSLAPTVMPYLLKVAQLEERMGDWDQASLIYQQLLQARYSVKEIQEKLSIIEKARELEKGQSMWNKWVDKKDKQAPKGQSKEKDDNKE